MRFIRCAGIAVTLTLAAAALAGSAVPALAGTGPVVSVTPSTAAPGTTVTFAITCSTGAMTATSATLSGTTLGLSEHIPMSQSQGGDFVVSVDLPTDILPGTYTPSIDCNDGVSGTATLTVNPLPGPSSPAPSGAPLTGDGTTSGGSGGLFTAAGFGLLAAGGLALIFAIARRRRSGSAS